MKLYIVVLALALSYCQSQPAIDNIDMQPREVAADKPLANAFKLLDGHWRGNFFIFTSNNNRPESNKWLPASKRDLEKRFKLVNKIEVEQIYQSLTPYFQKVSITDTYFTGGKAKKVKSKGVNKIQEGRAWCIVKKPHETVIHAGILKSKDTIVWHRDVRDPLRKEYFSETVLANTYTIKGWGYYNQADTKGPPSHWFWGEYRRLNK